MKSQKTKDQNFTNPLAGLTTNSIPYVGQLVDYFPTNNFRGVAVVLEVHPCDEVCRPRVDLSFFKGDKLQYCKEVEPVAPDPEQLEDEIDLEGRWAFQQEFNINTPVDVDDSNLLGTQSNRHVGILETHF